MDLYLNWWMREAQRWVNARNVIRYAKPYVDNKLNTVGTYPRFPDKDSPYNRLH